MRIDLGKRQGDDPGRTTLRSPSYPHQLEALASTAKFTLQSGAYGSGKTLTNAWIILTQALRYPNTVGLVGMETLGQLKKTLQKDFDTLISDMRRKGLVTYHGTDRVYTFYNGTQVLFESLSGGSPDAMKDRLRSLNLGFAVIEEITAIGKETVLEVLGRLRHENGSRQLFASCNPDGPEHYLYEWFFREERPGHRVIVSDSYSNPNLPKDYITMLENSLGPELARRYLKGEWVSMQGLVYPDFRRETHVRNLSEIKRDVKARFGALDFGGANPHCMLWFEEDSQGYIYVTKEWYKSQAPLSELAAIIKADPVPIVYCDHDLTDRLTLQNDFGVRGLSKANKDKVRGISTVQQFLRPMTDGQNPRLRIDASCRSLIRELGTYRYGTGKGSSDPSNEPVKKDDHSLDALRYALFTRYGISLGAYSTYSQY